MHQLQTHLYGATLSVAGQTSILLVALDFPNATHLHRQAWLQRDGFLPYLINRVGVALVAQFTQQALARHELTIDMWRVLAALSDKGRQRQVDLAGMTSIEASSLSRMVTRRTHRGVGNRRRCHKNGREVVVR